MTNMTPEAKELYNYIMSRDKIKEALELNASDKRILYEVRAVVYAASMKYGIEYCSDNQSPFSLNDHQEVTIRIVREITNFDEIEFEKCKQYLVNFISVNESDVFEPYEIIPRKSESHLEVMGVFLEAWSFINQYVKFKTTFTEFWNNISGERETGRFDCNDNYELYLSDYYVGAFIISGSLAWAEIWSKSKDKVIAYVRLETI